MHGVHKERKLVVRDVAEQAWRDPLIPTIIQADDHTRDKPATWGPKTGSYIWRTPPKRQPDQFEPNANEFSDLPLNWIFCARLPQ